MTQPHTGPVAQAPEQRRTLAVLLGAQVLSGAGLAAGVTVGALLAQEMLGSASLAGLPIALFTIGSALAAASVGRLSQRSGRRAGLTAGYLAGAVGSAGVVLAAVLGNVVGLLAGLFVYGAGAATNLQARYAGADLASPQRRARAVATVLVATTLGAVVGPNLVGVLGDLATSWGIPPLAGPFLLATAAYAAGAAVLWVLLRPDPLLLARSRAGGAAGSADPTGTVPSRAATAARAALGTGRRRWSGPLAFGAVVMVVTQLVMVAIMTMTPVHLTGHGHDVATAGVVISVHVAAMFLPAPLSGWLVDRFGAAAVAGLAAVTMLVAGILAAAAPAGSVATLAVALGALGLGWSLGLVSGTAMITAAAPIETRASVQGSGDVLIALAGAAGGALSGVVVARSGYAALALGGGLLALALVPVVALSARASTRPKTSP